MAPFHRKHPGCDDEETRKTAEKFRSIPGFGQQPSSYSQLVTLAILLYVIAVCVMVTHWPALSSECIMFDDHQYLHENQLVQNPSLASARRFLAEVLRPSTVKGYYQPLTMISLMLDYAAGGRPDNLLPFRRTSLALHVMNTMLVVVFIYLLCGRIFAAAAVGLLFGLHPITVEPIPWLAERKALLAAFLALWCLVFYVLYTRKGNWILCAAAGLMYMLALMAKPTAIPLPVLMLLLDYWPLQRLSRKTVLEKVPFFAIGAVFGVLIFISQSTTFGVRTPGEYGPASVALIICHNIVFYLGRFIWPVRSSAFYPFPLPFTLRNPTILVSVVATCLLLSALFVSVRWTRALLAGWLFFFVGLLPAMGIIGFHDMIAADRHAYLPLVGILVVLAYLLCRLWDTAKTASARRLRQVGTLAVMFALVGLELLATREYLAHWRDTETLNRHMLALAPHEPVLHNSLARALAEQGRFEEAVKHYTEALHHKSSVAGALGLEVGIASKIHFHLANALGRLGRLKEAVGHYEMASRIRPNSPDVHNNVGKALAEMGMLDEAIVHHSEAIRLEPGYAQAYCYRGIAFGRQRKLEQAAADFVTAIRLRPDYAEARMNLGIVLFHQGEFDRAIGQFRQALRIQPRDARIHCNLGVALMEKGNTDDALKEFRMALRCDPDFSQARKLLEDTLADKTDPELR